MPQTQSAAYFDVNRKDGGNAKISFHYQKQNGTWAKIDIQRAGWDDAIPWPLNRKTYSTTYEYHDAQNANDPNSGLGYHQWRLDETAFAGRQGIKLHWAFSEKVDLPISYGSFGCIVADGKKLDEIVKVMDKNNIDKDVDVRVRGFNPVLALELSAAHTTVAEGNRLTLDVKLTGDANGVSKGCYVLVKQTGLQPGQAEYGKDLVVDTRGTDGTIGGGDDLVRLNGRENAANHAQIIPDTGNQYMFVYVKPGQTGATLTFDVRKDNDIRPGSENITFEIVDYYFDSPSSKFPTIDYQHPGRLYSDYMKINGEKVLIHNSNDVSETIQITDSPSLSNVNVSQSGGIEGYDQTFSGKPGESYVWRFDAEKIPDTLRIFDGSQSYLVYIDKQSGIHTGAFTLGANSTGNVRIMVTGSSNDTHWDLTVGVRGKASHTITGSAASETIYSSSQGDYLVGYGGGDHFIGSKGVDVVRYDYQQGSIVADLAAPTRNQGAAKGDSYIGIEGLMGSAGADRLSGDIYGNWLYGGGGADTLYGGGGGDHFVFNADPQNAPIDTILDFDPKLDQIVLDHRFFKDVGSSGVLAGKYLSTTMDGEAHRADDHILYDRITGVVSYDNNGDKPGHENPICVIRRGLTVAADDFYII